MKDDLPFPDDLVLPADQIAEPAALKQRIDDLRRDLPADKDFRKAVVDLLNDTKDAARDRIAARHLAGAATEIIWGALTPLLEART